MLDVKFLIEARKNYPTRRDTGDEWLNEIIFSPIKEDVFFVVKENFFRSLDNSQKDILEEKYNIAGVFDLGSPYTNTSVRWILVHATVENMSELEISVFNAKVYDKKEARLNNCGNLETPSKYSPKFLSYVNELEKWLNNGITPDHDRDGQYEYNLIPYSEVDFDKLYPRYYSRRALDVRELAKKEHFAKLSDVADIITPRENRNINEKVKVIRPKDLLHPLNNNTLDFGNPTSVVLQEKDIILSRTNVEETAFYNLKSTDPVYASPFLRVIRCKNILPEYLYLYLKSETAEYLREALMTGGAISNITMEDLKNFPVARPSLDDEEYINDFNIITSVENREYKAHSKNPELEDYYKYLEAIKKQEEEPEHVEDIVNIELANKIKVHDEEQLRTFLNDDLKELNTCFRYKAYKATLILAGSILEAVLIDWLSEIKHKNYFEEDYTICDKKTGKQRNADLRDYINEIKYIEYPDWMEEADKAHIIRKKRNLVHAKLCMKSDEINEASCRQVIDYLKDVLKTRGVS